MVYRSNVDELPEMVRYLLDERRAWQVELRYTFDVPHLPEGFREAEFLDAAQWLELRDRLAIYPSDRVQLSLPPVGVMPVATGGAIVRDQYMARMSWDGSFRLFGVEAASRGDNLIERQVLAANVREIGDPRAFLAGLSAYSA